MWYQPNDKDHLSRSTVELKWSLWPRSCYSSGKLLWLTRAYRARRLITGPGEPIVEDRWYECNELLLLKIKLGC